MDLPVRVITCTSSGDQELLQFNDQRLACMPTQEPILKWCSKKEEEASNCGRCLKPESEAGTE